MGNYYELVSAKITPKIHLFHLGSGPRCFAEEFQAGFDAGLLGETSDIDYLSHLLPAIALYQLLKHRLQCDVVQGIIGLFI